MPPPTWATPEQLQFLKSEDTKWALIKASTGLLKTFYTRTAYSFLKMWPAVPDAKILAEAKNDLVKAQELANEQVHKVSIPATHTTSAPSHRTQL